MSKQLDKLDYGVIYALLSEKITTKEFVFLEMVTFKTTKSQAAAIKDRNNQRIKQHEWQLKNDTYYADLIRLRNKIKSGKLEGLK